MSKSILITCCIALLWLVWNCTQGHSNFDQRTLLSVPAHFPEVPFTEDNPFSEAKWRLGKRLFFDPMLSKDSSVSCASCHHPELAFSDSVALSRGAAGAVGKRNAPTLTNVAYLPYFTKEGGVPTLEMQMLIPIHEKEEFDFNVVLIADRMQAVPEYVQLSEKAFGKAPDPYVITRAIATFERSIISANSKYDALVATGDSAILSAKERLGLKLFYSDKAQCASCHAGFNFTTSEFANNGLYEQYNDPGRFRLTGDSADLAMFKVPSLRNVTLTSPYMHDGTVESLSDVLLHYNQGGVHHPQKDSRVRELNLTTDELQALEAFLGTLTDTVFIRSPHLNLNGAAQLD